MNTNVTRPVFKSKNGFSLTELLITVVIIGILAAVVLPKFSKVVAGMKTGEAERLLTAVRQEQEARCTLGKNYTTNTSEIAALPKGTGSNFTYQFSASGMSAVSNEGGYTLSIPSYIDGRICCSGACAGLNKQYLTCDELKQKPNYQVSTQCTGDVPPADCEDGQTRNVSAHCGHQSGDICAGGTWTPLPESIDLTDAEKADCNQCSTPPELSQPCPNGTPAMCTREKTCNTSNGQWKAGEWDCSACNTSSRTPCEEPWTAEEKENCECDTKEDLEKPCPSGAGKQTRTASCNSATGKRTYTDWDDSQCAEDCCAPVFSGDFSKCLKEKYGSSSAEHICANTGSPYECGVKVFGGGSLSAACMENGSENNNPDCAACVQRTDFRAFRGGGYHRYACNGAPAACQALHGGDDGKEEGGGGEGGVDDEHQSKCTFVRETALAPQFTVYFTHGGVWDSVTYTMYGDNWQQQKLCSKLGIHEGDQQTFTGSISSCIESFTVSCQGNAGLGQFTCTEQYVPINPVGSTQAVCVSNTQYLRCR